MVTTGSPQGPPEVHAHPRSAGRQQPHPCRQLRVHRPCPGADVSAGPRTQHAAAHGDPSAESVVLAHLPSSGVARAAESRLPGVGHRPRMTHTHPVTEQCGDVRAWSSRRDSGHVWEASRPLHKPRHSCPSPSGQRLSLALSSKGTDPRVTTLQ